MGGKFLAIPVPAGYLALDQPPSPVVGASGSCFHGADRGAPPSRLGLKSGDPGFLSSDER